MPVNFTSVDEDYETLKNALESQSLSEVAEVVDIDTSHRVIPAVWFVIGFPEFNAEAEIKWEEPSSSREYVGEKATVDVSITAYAPKGSSLWDIKAVLDDIEYVVDIVESLLYDSGYEPRHSIREQGEHDEFSLVDGSATRMDFQAFFVERADAE